MSKFFQNKKYSEKCGTGLHFASFFNLFNFFFFNFILFLNFT